MTQHLGFTGTRHGMNVHQRSTVFELLRQHGAAGLVAHHGDCVGADAQFHQLCRSLLGADVQIIIHPGPPGDPYRADCIGDLVLTPSQHMKRNLAIVNASSVMVAGPLEDEPQPRGGTWRTIGMARKALKRGTLRTLYVVGRGGKLLDHTRWP